MQGTRPFPGVAPFKIWGGQKGGVRRGSGGGPEGVRRGPEGVRGSGRGSVEGSAEGVGWGSGREFGWVWRPGRREGEPGEVGEIIHPNIIVRKVSVIKQALE